MNTGLLGDFTKGFVIMIGVLWIFIIIQLIIMRQIAIALLFLLTLMIPLSMISLEYLRNQKKEKNNPDKR